LFVAQEVAAVQLAAAQEGCLAAAVGRQQRNLLALAETDKQLFTGGKEKQCAPHKYKIISSSTM
jgi:hypothetical protein